MQAKVISSLHHPLIARWVQLRTKREAREEAGRVLISGQRMVHELALEVLITTEPSHLEAKEKYLVTDAILKKITGLNEPDGFAAEVALPQPQDVKHGSHLLVLDQIADPGNCGTLLRSALALGWDGVIVTPGTVDLFNDKALRAGKGAQFHLPFARMEWPEIAKLPHMFYTADLEGKPLGSVRPSTPLALILSSESHGPTQIRGEKITIPMNGKTESLNVASSGAILLYTMRPK